ncbi:MAG: class I SAM-dependent RNA methyltransferase [Neisseriaceae bacterium]|nr:class I SAM-dependent RNA methyltransferase [Neisseriaceae bacterium]
MTDFSIVLTCPRGLESVLTTEIATIVGKNAIVGNGFVRLENSTLADIYRLNLHSRVASKVLLQVAHSPYRNEDDIYRTAKSVAWFLWFSVRHTFKISIESMGSPLKSLNFAALRVKDAVCDCFREEYNERPSVDKDNPDIKIAVFLDKKTVSIYLDTSGEPLFKRGYRQGQGVAPLRENLAAGLLLLAGFNGDQAFFDPMAGSGTIAIEAALIAKNQATGLNRDFAFQKFNHFQAALWQKIHQQAQQAIIDAPHHIFAFDKDEKMVKIATQNARNAGVAKDINFQAAHFPCDNLLPNAAGLLLTNPPYGERLETQQIVQKQYPQWAACLKQQFAGWTAGFFTADRELPKIMRLLPKRKIPLYNGKLDCRLFLFDIVSGSHRRQKI